MEHLHVLLHGLVGLLVFTAPGMIVLLGLSRRRLPEWPLALVLAASFVLSCLVVAAWQAVSLAVLGPAASRLAAWGLMAALCLWVVRTGGRVIAGALRQLGAWERRSLAVLGAILLFWLLAVPLSPYPSQTTMDLGDPPVYSRTAEDVVAGRGWRPDCFIADYPGGRMAYVSGHPVPVLLATLLLQVCGAHWCAVHVATLIAGALVAYLFAALVVGGGARPRDSRAFFVVACSAALLPTHFVLFGLGVLTAPGALALLAAVALSARQVAEPRLARLLWVASLVLMLGLRPEAALLAVLFGGVCLARGVMAVTVGRRGIRALVLLAAAGAAACAWRCLPVMVSALPRSWRTLAAYYVKFDPAQGTFVPMYTPFWELNRAWCRDNFVGEDALARLGNPGIGVELSQHPLAYLGFAARHVPGLAQSLVRAFTVAQLQFRGLLGLPLVLAAGVVLALAAANPNGRCLAAAALLFFLLVAMANPVPHVRHMLPLSPSLLALALGGLWGRLGGPIERALSARWALAAAVLLLLGFLDGRSVIRIRTYGPNRAYVPILQDVERVAAPHDLVASSYPQLVTCMTGRPAVGGTWLVENLPLIVKTRRPDIIVVDNENDVVRNYDLLSKRGSTVPGYEPVVHDEARRYIIFRREAAATSGPLQVTEP